MKRLVLISHMLNRQNELVKAAAYRRGAEVFHLELGNRPERYEVKSEGLDVRIKYNDIEFCAENFVDTRVLYLPFDVSRPHFVGGVLSDFDSREWNALFSSFVWNWYEGDSSLWLIRPDALEMQDRKVNLLWTVSRLNLRTLKIPTTRLGNRFELDRSQQLVAKSINAWQEVAPGRYFNTTWLSKDQTAVLSSKGSTTPVIIQTWLPHLKELRVYVAREALYAVSIRASEHIADFRMLKKGQELHPVTQELLDGQVRDELILVCRSLSLDYCVFDVMVEDGSADLYLCDINPTGSWSYLMRDFGLDITDFVLDHI